MSGGIPARARQSLRRHTYQCIFARLFLPFFIGVVMSRAQSDGSYCFFNVSPFRWATRLPSCTVSRVRVASKNVRSEQWGSTKATYEEDITGCSPSESKQTEFEREEGELGVLSASLTGSSGSLSESEGIPKPEVRRGWLGGREQCVCATRKGHSPTHWGWRW